MQASADIAITGLATMGRNLARNMARHGYTVAVHNRSPERTRSLVADHGDEGAFVPCESLESLVSALRPPRTVIVLVRAGEATDAVIDSLAVLLGEGDVIVDAGNGHVADTRRRAERLAPTGLHLVGAGISGGGQGALLGPSIMVGGSATSYDIVGPLLETVAARVGDQPCCAHVGPDGAGHFVKMVHNGIEYAVMQLIAESYDVMRHRCGLAPAAIGEVFAQWATGDLGSFLVEVTARVLRHTDEASGEPFVDVVRDQAGQKGTGRWSVQTALDLGVPATAIAEATLARALSSSTAQREVAQERLTGGAPDAGPVDPDDLVEDVRRALYAATLVAYSQGFEIIAAASQNYDWDVDRAEVARIWRGGCIIRARLLDSVMASYRRDPALPLLLAADEIAVTVANCLPAWRRLVADAALTGIPLPAFASSLFFYDAIRARRLPAALVQAQRDVFGAHTYERVDKPGSFHTLWAGTGEEIEM